MRCKPNDLARVIRSDSGNEGRMVMTIRLISPYEALWAWRGGNWVGCGPIWICQPLQAIRQEAFDGQLLALRHDCVPFFDGNLRPIRDNPGTDETLTDVFRPAPVVA